MLQTYRKPEWRVRGGNETVFVSAQGCGRVAGVQAVLNAAVSGEPFSRDGA
jgi:hypothetical protein